MDRNKLFTEITLNENINGSSPEALEMKRQAGARCAAAVKIPPRSEVQAKADIAPTATIETIKNGRFFASIRSNGIFTTGIGDTPRAAYKDADRNLRAKINWGPLHDIMTSKAKGCYTEYKIEIARLHKLARAA